MGGDGGVLAVCKAGFRDPWKTSSRLNVIVGRLVVAIATTVRINPISPSRNVGFDTLVTFSGYVN